MLDKHYTPPIIAADLISAARIEAPKLVADFAAGHGELLRQAATRWTTASMLATDVDSRALRHLRATQKEWSTFRADFLNERTRDSVLSDFRGRVDLVVLNPPFSCRGASFHTATFQNIDLRCSTALAFIIGSLSYLSPTGELVAVMPRGSLRSEKDSRCWSFIRRIFDVSVRAEFGRQTFPDLAVKSVIIRVSRRADRTLACVEGRNRFAVTAVVRRGTVQVHRAEVSRRRSVGALPFVHTTNLQNNRIDQPCWIRSKHSVVAGPAVLLPRVGRPDHRKFVILREAETVVLSDCVFAVLCESNVSAHELLQSIIEHRDVIYDAYGGTCAPYLTITHLQDALCRIESLASEDVAVAAAR